MWFFAEKNDLPDLSKEYSNYVLKKYLEQPDFSQLLVEKQKIVDEIQTTNIEKEFIKFQKKKDAIFYFADYKIKDVFFLNHLRRFFSWRLQIDLTPEEIIKNEDYKLFKEIMLKSKKEVIKNNAELIFVSMPFYPGIKKNTERYENYLKILKIIDDLNINTIDLQKLMFEKTEDPKKFFPFKKHGHYTPEGYKIASNIILSNIILKE